MSQRSLRTLYDFQGDSTLHQVSFNAGELIIQLDEPGEGGWCWGKTVAGAEGYFPISYAQADSNTAAASAGVASQAQNPPPGTSDDDWMETFDSDGSKFFYNKVTRKCTWTDPRASQVAAAAAVASVAALAPVEEEAPLAPGWAANYDATYGKYYYFNRGTGVTQWDKPVSPKLSGRPASVGISQGVSMRNYGGVGGPGSRASVAVTQGAAQRSQGAALRGKLGQQHSISEYNKHHTAPVMNSERFALQRSASDTADEGWVKFYKRACEGVVMLKKRGSEKNYNNRFLFVREDLTEFCWARSEAKRASANSMPMQHILDVQMGHPENCSSSDAKTGNLGQTAFTLRANTSGKTIDLKAFSAQERGEWVAAIKKFVEVNRTPYERVQFVGRMKRIMEENEARDSFEQQAGEVQQQQQQQVAAMMERPSTLSFESSQAPPLRESSVSFEATPPPLRGSVGGGAAPPALLSQSSSNTLLRPPSLLSNTAPHATPTFAPPPSLLSHQTPPPPVSAAAAGGAVGVPPPPPSFAASPQQQQQVSSPRAPPLGARGEGGAHPRLPDQLSLDIALFQMEGYASKFFARRKKGMLFFSSYEAPEELVSFAAKPIAAPLNVLSSNLSKPAVGSFRNIMMFMGDSGRSGAGNEDIASMVVEIGQRQPKLHDEILCQVIKQCNNNPHPESELLGWELLCLCISTFPPTPQLRAYVTEFAAARVARTDGVGALALYVQRLVNLHAAATEGAGVAVSPLSLADVRMVEQRAVFGGGTLDSVLLIEELGAVTDAALRADRERLPPGVPVVMQLLLEAVTALNGETVDGIFRKASERDSMLALQRCIEHGDYAELRNPGASALLDSAHIPADLLKTWLRGLKEPLIPFSLYDNAISAAKTDADACIRVVHAAGAARTACLRVLLQFMARLSQHSGATQMTISNLALVIGPNLLKNQSDDPMLFAQNTNYETQFVSTLMEAADRL